RFRELRTGKVADYIPELARTDPDNFAIAVVTVTGQVFEVGDHDHEFTIQSMSKPLIYGLALDRMGRKCVHSKVSVEPTGEAFNSIIELEEDHLPYNPMINSGAIAMSALLHHADRDNAKAQIMEMFGAYLGREAEVHREVRESELDASHRNRAIAHLLRHFEVIGDDIDGALKLYAHQCAVTANTRELAMIAATLANGGVHPVTGQRAVRREHLRDILTLMFTCGMYDSSGAWAYTVGLPAKSGVSGGILAVVPGRMGIAAYSPRLDARGHSVRAVEVFKALSTEWGLSMFGT
ncbi:MAG TPA: glutaminase A, partial [Ramlibacter sp.]